MSRTTLRVYGLQLVRWLITGVSVALGGLATGLAPMFISQGETFNFKSTWNSELMLMNIGWCLFISWLLFVARNPIPVPEIEGYEAEDEEPKQKTAKPETQDAKRTTISEDPNI
jgi:hypothetical protein